MHQALYRKWRPKSFSDMKGQDAVIDVLKKEVDSARLSHAYIFCGTRGTGKTTAAKVLAKAVNCLSPIEGDPCNSCEHCIAIDEGSVTDVVEIDAASNNGVDNVREMREQVQFSPMRVKYRVYIIDEVHMLTPSAFNALLKTLEEPPPHVIFILATTERHKIPATIMSRCQCFEFTRIAIADITERLLYVAGQEGIELSEEAAMLIARLADGALRNALSILDQCMAMGGEVTRRAVESVAGLVKREYLFSISKALANKDVGALLTACDEAGTGSKEILVVLSELMTHIRDLLVAKTVSSPTDIMRSPPSEFEEIINVAAMFDTAHLLRVLKALQSATYEISKSPVKNTLLEAILIELCSGTYVEQTVQIQAVQSAPNTAPIAKPTPKTAPTPKVEMPAAPYEGAPDSQDMPPWDDVEAPPIESYSPPEEYIPPPPPKPEGREPPRATTGNLPPFWDDMLKSLNPALSPALVGANVGISGDTVTISPAKAFGYRFLSKDSSKKELEAKASAAAGRNISIVISQETGSKELASLAKMIAEFNEED